MGNYITDAPAVSNTVGVERENMSAYSDWKCGALSDEEYKTISRMEARMDNYEPIECDGNCAECEEDCDYREDE